MNIFRVLFCNTSGRDIFEMKLQLARLINIVEEIMSKISDFAAAQNAFNDRIDGAVTGLIGDVESLNAEIVKLQTSAGEVSAEDQASLDALQARGETIAAKVEALDAMTPPVVPA